MFAKFFETMQTPVFTFNVNTTRVFIRVWGVVLAAFLVGLILG